MKDEVQGRPSDDDHLYDDYFEEEDDEYCAEEDCGRWYDGRLSDQCALAGTEWCDWECPIGLGGKR